MKYPLIKLKYYIVLFKDIVGFIKTPKNEADLEKSTKFKIYDTIGLYILKLVCLIPVFLLFAFIEDPKNLTSASMSERFSPLVFLLVGGFILPLLEEIEFRLSLKFRPVFLALSLSGLMYTFLTKAIYHTKISMVDESFIWRVVLAITFGVLIFPLINISPVKQRLTQFWSNHFRAIYYLVCIVFAWMHISKYELNWVNILLLPILTLPQLMSAIISGYTRVRFGFEYPLLFHMSTNVLAVGLSLLSNSD